MDTIRHTFNLLRAGTATDKLAALRAIEVVVREDAPAAQQILMPDHRGGLTIVLECLYGENERLRESAARLLIAGAPAMQPGPAHAERLFTALYDRLGAYDWEGTAAVPEAARPTPSQLPCRVKTHPEPCEEIRLLLAQLFHDFLAALPPKERLAHAAEAVDILCVLAMDSAPPVQLAACAALSPLLSTASFPTDAFCEKITRSFLLLLASSKSRQCCAALRALSDLLVAARHKGILVLEILSGYRDPHSVPIRDFYEPSLTVNYLALLFGSPSLRARRELLLAMERWLTQQFREDLAPRLLPYLLSLLDEAELGAEAALALQRVGKHIEADKEELFRTEKQFGLQPYNAGRRVEPPFAELPCLGAKHLVASNLTCLFAPIHRELKDTVNIEAAKKAARLIARIFYIAAEECASHYAKAAMALVAAFKLMRSDTFIEPVFWVGYDCRSTVLVAEFCRKAIESEQVAYVAVAAKYAQGMCERAVCTPPDSETANRMGDSLSLFIDVGIHFLSTSSDNLLGSFLQLLIEQIVFLARYLNISDEGLLSNINILRNLKHVELFRQRLIHGDLSLHQDLEEPFLAEEKLIEAVKAESINSRAFYIFYAMLLSVEKSRFAQFLGERLQNEEGPMTAVILHWLITFHPSNTAVAETIITQAAEKAGIMKDLSLFFSLHGPGTLLLHSIGDSKVVGHLQAASTFNGSECLLVVLKYACKLAQKLREPQWVTHMAPLFTYIISLPLDGNEGPLIDTINDLLKLVWRLDPLSEHLIPILEKTLLLVETFASHQCSKATVGKLVVELIKHSLAFEGHRSYAYIVKTLQALQKAHPDVFRFLEREAYQNQHLPRLKVIKSLQTHK